ncbi:sushi, von Willebrand factor type A, EGF and pentraxin domain-containing protein 1-like isoform X1 [Crassostrea angulata]|uniref:sushi, von Willebrand factor type A, EGF and pentraxin domain-containing protein 1-like isoform X1 n=1 Tax=Magallana angulata TaxID=2784310 RepID=UPI0022B13718|nr:sushi, von Willebrand factor type A, EGF and pentraxin domain-containing protein 1-like isoform X1 [Crassostrea angulata]
MALTLSSTKFRLLLGVCLSAILINVAGSMSFGGGTEDKKTCRVSELDVNEKGDDDRLVQNGDPFLYGDTIYTCVDGRWLNRASDIPSTLRRKKRGWSRLKCKWGWSRKCDKVNIPPKFTSCPPSGVVIYADRLRTTANHSWTQPTATDPEQGVLPVTLSFGKESGSEFDRGFQAITYEAVDNGGQRAICSFSFTVKVTSCSPIKWPVNGNVNCPPGEFLYGTTCNVTCQKGYEMVPMTNDGIQSITCNANGHKNSLPNICQLIECPSNDPKLYPEHGTVSCTNSNYYNSLCTTKCKEGYTRKMETETVCGEDKTWSNKTPDCKDSQPPLLKRCPENIYTYANKTGPSDPVTWASPLSEDNSGISFVNQTVGPINGSSFPVGQTEIRYIASDLDGNVSPECVFFVIVEEIICEPPLILDSYMTIECPDGYTYGSTCKLGCKSVFPLIGQSNITCEKNITAYPLKGYWNAGGTQPYCQKNPCNPLPSPLNGAMVCDTWLYGRFCQMQCTDKFDIPYGVAGTNGGSFTGAYTCSDLQGTFTPSNVVANCTVRKNPRKTGILGEFSYYTGDCNDATVLTDIKTNFINLMQYQEKRGFAGVCPDETECNVNNTVVTCGPVSGRRKKRHTHEIGTYSGYNSMPTDRTKRNTHEIRVETLLTTSWYNFNSSNVDTFYFLESLQTKLFDVIKDLGRNGSLTVRALSPDNNSFQLGYSDPFCDEGLAVRWSTLTCVPCSVGTYLDNTDPWNPKCYDCPKGTYKDTEDALSCTSCPVGTSTLNQASISENECIAQCKPGEYSVSGLVPCSPCPRSSYQPQSMSSTCLACPPGKSSKSGSTMLSECKDFDVVFKQSGDSLSFSANLTSEETQLTISMWIKIPTALNNIALYKAGTASCDIEILYRNMLYFIINGNEISSNITLNTETWTHVAFILDTTNQFAHIFIDGTKTFSTSIPLAPGISVIDSFSSIIVQNNQENINSVAVSGYRLITGVSSDSDVAQLASMCNASLSSLIDLTIENLIGASVAVPSVCYSTNHCNPNPCNGQICVSEAQSFVCQCENGFTGDNCQNAPRLCSETTCDNAGTCTNNGVNFTCICPTGYRGKRCEIQIVNGGWSEWNAWASCSTTCNGGMKTRTRECKSPPPDSDGIPCDSQFFSESVACNTAPCPSCSELPKSFGTKSNCSTNQDGNTACSLSCRPGLIFSIANPPLDEYICGPGTAYEWNGIPPACGRGHGPRNVQIKANVGYGRLIPCTKAASVAQSLKNNMQGGLQCRYNNICDVQVEISDCALYGRKRRSTSSSIVVTLSVTFTSTDIDLTSYDLYENMSQPLAELFTAIDELSASADQLNSSYSLLSFVVDGITYTSSDVSLTDSVLCESTFGTTDVLCVECPSGTYYLQGLCEVCPIGTYQDEMGKTYCKTCPSGYTTQFVASQSSTACSVPSSASTTENNVKQFLGLENQYFLIISASGSLIVIIAVVAIVSICIYRCTKRSQSKINTERSISRVNRNTLTPNGSPPPYEAWGYKK